MAEEVNQAAAAAAAWAELAGPAECNGVSEVDGCVCVKLEKPVALCGLVIVPLHPCGLQSYHQSDCFIRLCSHVYVAFRHATSHLL